MEHNRVIYERQYDAEVEYLESSENQFIDTGIIISSNIGILADIQMATNNVGWFFGGGEGYLINEFGIMTDANYSIFRFGNKEVRLTPLRNTEKITFDNLENPNVLKVGNLIYTTTYNTFTSAATMYLFANNRINTAKRSTVGVRIFYFKIYYSGILVRDFIPVRIGSVGYMYDRVSDKLFGNKGTGKFTLGSDVANPIPNIRRVFRFENKRFVMSMPYDSEVEYLETNGTQFIRLGLQSLPAQTKVEYKAKGSTSLNSNSRVISYGSVSNKNNFTVWEQKTKFYASMLGSEVAINSNQVTSEHTIVQERVSTTSGTFSINGNVSNINGNYIEKSGNLALLANNVGEQSYLGKIYYLKLWTNNMLIYDLIPVRRGNVGYLYDKVSGKLFGNAGTGQFILGNDIND